MYGATKVTFHNRRILAEACWACRKTAITMVEQDVGGGFGVRGEFYPEDFLIPFAARQLGAAGEMDRGPPRAPARDQPRARRRMRAGDRLRARRHDPRRCAATHAVDRGAYMRTNGATAARNVAQVLSGPYRIPNIHVDVALLMTNKTPAGTYRGPGRFEADFFRERLFDMAAKDLGIDRVEFRRRNLIAESEMPWPLATVMPFDIRRPKPTTATIVPRSIAAWKNSAGRRNEPAGQADRRPLSRHRRRLLSRRRRLGPARECAACA